VENLIITYITTQTVDTYCICEVCIVTSTSGIKTVARLVRRHQDRKSGCH